MDSKRSFSFALYLLFCLSSSSRCCFAQDASMTECVKKLMPCQPYLHSPSPSPPAMCCDPLKEMAKGDANCLCAVFNNPAIMKSLNITEKDALGLVKACGANADTSVCKKGATTPTGSPSTANSSAGSNSTGGVTTESSATGISESGGLSFVAALLVALIISKAFY